MINVSYKFKLIDSKGMLDDLDYLFKDVYGDTIYFYGIDFNNVFKSKYKSIEVALDILNKSMEEAKKENCGVEISLDDLYIPENKELTIVPIIT